MSEARPTNNHYATAHQALMEANRVLAANGLPSFTYGAQGKAGSGCSGQASGGIYDMRYWPRKLTQENMLFITSGGRRGVDPDRRGGNND